MTYPKTLEQEREDIALLALLEAAERRARELKGITLVCPLDDSAHAEIEDLLKAAVRLAAAGKRRSRGGA